MGRSHVTSEKDRSSLALEDPPDDETGVEEFVEHELESLGHGAYWRHNKDLDAYDW